MRFFRSQRFAGNGELDRNRLLRLRGTRGRRAIDQRQLTLAIPDGPPGKAAGALVTHASAKDALRCAQLRELRRRMPLEGPLPPGRRLRRQIDAQYIARVEGHLHARAIGRGEAYVHGARAHSERHAKQRK